jgi:hypothetical protein
VTSGGTALARAGMFLLLPVIGILLLPVLLFFIIALYLLAILQGGRVFVYSFSAKAETTPDHDLQEPHFVRVRIRDKSLTDESAPSQGE